MRAVRDEENVVGTTGVDGPGAREIPEALQEPDRLVIPEPVVAQLLDWAFQTQPGAAWLAGYVLGRGEPSWFAERRWTLRTRVCEIVKTESSEAQPGTDGANGTGRANGALPRPGRE